jgi:hypothetical protein
MTSVPERGGLCRWTQPSARPAENVVAHRRSSHATRKAQIAAGSAHASVWAPGSGRLLGDVLHQGSSGLVPGVSLIGVSLICTLIKESYLSISNTIEKVFYIKTRFQISKSL